MKRIGSQYRQQAASVLSAVRDAVEDVDGEITEMDMSTAETITGVVIEPIADCQKADPYTGFKALMTQINAMRAQMGEMLEQAREYAHQISTYPFDEDEISVEQLAGYKKWVEKELEYIDQDEDRGISVHDINDILYPAVEEIKAYQKHTRDQIKEHVTEAVKELIEQGVLQAGYIMNEQEPTGQIGGSHELRVMRDPNTGKLVMMDNGTECMSVNVDISAKTNLQSSTLTSDMLNLMKK